MKSWRAISVSAATLACIASVALLWPRVASTQPSAAQSQQTPSSQVPNIEEYNPKSTLVVPKHKDPAGEISVRRYSQPSLESHPRACRSAVKEMDTINLQCW